MTKEKRKSKAKIRELLLLFSYRRIHIRSILKMFLTDRV